MNPKLDYIVSIIFDQFKIEYFDPIIHIWFFSLLNFNLYWGSGQSYNRLSLVGLLCYNLLLFHERVNLFIEKTLNIFRILFILYSLEELQVFSLSHSKEVLRVGVSIFALFNGSFR